jgi:hypothetical protein
MKYNVVILQGMRKTYKVGLMTAIPESLIVFLVMALFFGAIALMVSVLRSGIDRQAAGLWRIEAKRDLLLNDVGREFDPYKALPREVADAIGRGEKIRAIKSWREVTGAGLREAKDFIEEAQRRSSSGTRG